MSEARVLEIVKYGHPVLRQKGAPVEKVTPEIKQLIGDMLLTMKEAHGVGLAAQQVGQAIQLTVLDVRGIEDRPSTLQIHDKEADVDKHMPMVLMNPAIKPLGDAVEGPEGCLSFPEVYADISRPASVEVTAMNPQGESIRFKCGGLLARAIQHETDHLHGILFIDRMSRETKEEVREKIQTIQASMKAKLKQA